MCIRDRAKVTLFTAVPEYEPPGEAELMARRAISLWDHERISRDKAQAILRPAAERLRTAGVECDTAYAECNRPHEAIIDAAPVRRHEDQLAAVRARSDHV